MRKWIVNALLVALSSFAFADHFTFVVTGDGRTNDQTPDPTGINMPVLTKLIAAINAEHPRFLLWNGDMIHGVYGKVTVPVDQQLTTWKQAMSGLRGIAIYPVRGNHETAGDPDGKEWLRLVKPMIDGQSPSYFEGENGFSYAATPKEAPGVTVIALDQYVRNHRVNLDELEKALKQAKRRGSKSIFVMAHEMAFTCTAHGDDDNLSKFRADRDTFIELLEMYGVRYFFAGHDHTYDWMEIRSPKWDADTILNQIVVGTAGAPFYKDLGYFGDHGEYQLTRKEHRDNTFGYMLVDVDDQGKVTATFKEVKP